MYDTLNYMTIVYHTMNTPLVINKTQFSYFEFFHFAGGCAFLLHIVETTVNCTTSHYYTGKITRDQFTIFAEISEFIEMEEDNSVPTFAVTAAVGAVVVLVMLFCTMNRKSRENEQGSYFQFPGLWQ